MSNEGPLLLIVSSPSGAGKTTLTNALRTNVSGLLFSVSHTTRKPRAGEVHGREYYFVDRPEFERLVEHDTFLEWAVVPEKICTALAAQRSSERVLRGGSSSTLWIIRSARQIKSTRPDAVAVFILPPNMNILEKRLRGRASGDEATVQRRYRKSRSKKSNTTGSSTMSS